MANTRLMKVMINSIDVSSYVRKWSVSQNFGNPIDSASIELIATVDTVLTLGNSQLVEIWHGYSTATDNKIFTGYVEKYEPDVGVIKVKAFSKLYAIVRNLISATIYDKSVVGSPIYPDGKYSDAFYDIVTTHAGLSATNGTTIQDSGTTKIINKMICYLTDPKERLDKIAEALQWIYYYRPDTDKVYFEPKQTTVNSSILTVGSNVVNIPKWKYDKTDLINDLRVDGATQEKLIEDLFSGDGANQTFTLSQTPTGDVSLYYSNTVNLSSNPVLQSYGKVLGVTNSSTGSYDYTVDKATKKISTVGSGGGGFTASANTNNVMASYVASVAVPIHKLDQPSIDAYTAHKKQMTLTDVITVADAESRASEILEKFKNPFQSATLNVKYDSSISLRVGNSILVVDSYSTPAVNDYLTIFGINYLYPGGYDEVMVGDREFETPEFFLNISEKLNALEKELYDPNSVLTELRSFTLDGTMEPHSLTITQQLVNDSFILDHDVNGVLYDSTETAIIDDFEVAATWAEDSGSVSLTETADSTSGHFWVGSQGLNYSWAVGSGNGIITAAPTSTDAKAIVASYCLNFDGTSDYVTVPHNAAYNAFAVGSNFTINFWVSPDNPSSANRRPVSKESSGTLQGWRFLHNENTGSIAWQVGNGTTVNTSPSGTISASSGWHMVTGVYDNTNSLLRLYVDGSQVSTGTAITVTGTITNAIDLVFGTNSSSPGGATDYDGRIANVAMWSRALGSSEITTLYNTPNSVSSTNLVGWWKLNDNSTTTSVDSSSTANNGTITAATVSNTWFYPWQGTAGVWVYAPQGADVSSLTLRIGSSSANYLSCTGKQYAWKVAGVESSFALDDALLTYVLFDLDAGTWATKAIDWTGIDYAQFNWGIASAGNMTFDYFTISKNNTIALNGLGDRITTLSTTTTNY